MSKSKKPHNSHSSLAGITDPGYSIGIRAHIRVQWWFLHARQ